MKTKFLLAVAVIAVTVCSCGDGSDWTRKEKSLINGEGDVMRVLTADNEEDSLFLRRKASPLTVEDLQSKEFQLLTSRMLATVKAPENDGVGIAAPQVGISRRVVAVMRYDKEGKPFEIFSNPKILSVNGGKESGPEGCLSVPGRRGDVPRYRELTLKYTSLATQEDTLETILGYTAVIIQHECDHLDGTLYTDKIK